MGTAAGFWIQTARSGTQSLKPENGVFFSMWDTAGGVLNGRWWIKPFSRTCFRRPSQVICIYTVLTDPCSTLPPPRANSSTWVYPWIKSSKGLPRIPQRLWVYPVRSEHSRMGPGEMRLFLIWNKVNSIFTMAMINAGWGNRESYPPRWFGPGVCMDRLLELSPIWLVSIDMMLKNLYFLRMSVRVCG